VQLVDPVPVWDGPVPLLQVVGGVVTDVGAEAMDPTGELRRRRRVANVHVAAQVSIADVAEQARWFLARSRWSERLRRALNLLHAAECAPAPEVRFVLNVFAFEVLAISPSTTLLALRVRSDQERQRLLEQLRRVFETHGFAAADADRWIERVQDTQAESPIDVAMRYVGSVGESIAIEELKWLRRQRGAYVHNGHFDRSAGAASRRESFRQLLRTLLQRELVLLDEGQDDRRSGA
jgi:hypothetical protein